MEVKKYLRNNIIFRVKDLDRYWVFIVNFKFLGIGRF